MVFALFVYPVSSGFACGQTGAVCDVAIVLSFPTVAWCSKFPMVANITLCACDQSIHYLDMPLHHAVGKVS